MYFVQIKLNMFGAVLNSYRPDFHSSQPFNLKTTPTNLLLNAENQNPQLHQQQLNDLKPLSTGGMMMDNKQFLNCLFWPNSGGNGQTHHPNSYNPTSTINVVNGLQHQLQQGQTESTSTVHMPKTQRQVPSIRTSPNSSRGLLFKKLNRN